MTDTHISGSPTLVADPVKSLEDSKMSQRLGDGLLDELTARTGLSRDEIVTRLSHAFPRTVDDLAPQGKLHGTTERDARNGTEVPTSLPSVGQFG